MGNPDAKRLYDDLLSNYNKLVRPVQNTTDPLTVRIKLKLSQLIDVVSIRASNGGSRRFRIYVNQTAHPFSSVSQFHTYVPWVNACFQPGKVPSRGLLCDCKT